MTVDFDALMRGPIHDAFGEVVTISPMARPGGVNAKPGPDPARAETSITAVFSQIPADFRDDDSRGLRGFDRLDRATALLSLEYRQADLAFDLRADDRVTRADGSIYVVTGVEVDDFGSAILSLNHVGVSG